MSSLATSTVAKAPPQQDLSSPTTTTDGPATTPQGQALQGQGTVGNSAVAADISSNTNNKNSGLSVDRGQVTFDAEGNEGGRFHSRTAHWPGGASGVTIGRGYDLGQQSKSGIIKDMTAAGISDGDANKFAPAAGKSGKDAKAWLDENGKTLPEITQEQQKKLFYIAYDRLAGDVARISTQYAKTVSERDGGKREDYEINWDTLHPAIKDILVDLRYRGDYTPNTRKFVQPLAIANDLAGMAKVMADRTRWSAVPKDRFERRAAFMQEAVQKGSSKVDLKGSGPVAADTTTGSTSPTNKPSNTSAAPTTPSVATPAGAGTGASTNKDAPEAKTTKDGPAPAANPAPTADAGGQQYNVTAGHLNVRSAPELALNNKIGALKRGDKVTATGTQGDWISIKHGGQVGWVNTQFLEKVSTTTAKKDATTTTGTAAASGGNYRLSGGEWVGIANSNGWSNSTKFEDLEPTFGGNARTFVEGLRSNGVKVDITAGLRHKKRAYLMHYAWHVSKGSKSASEANRACRAEGIEIEWDHGDTKKTQAAAAALVRGFGLVHAASLTSNHMSGEAIDMQISSVPSKLTIAGKSYTAAKKTSGTMEESKVSHIGKELGVIWFGAGDWVHWSKTGR